jgi:hypothetical protein
MNHFCIKAPNGRAATNREMLALLGITASRLPDHALPHRFIQGIKVWVTPARRLPPPAVTGPWRRSKSSAHRVMGECPNCSKHMSVGRMHQHKCGPGAIYDAAVPLNTSVGYAWEHPNPVHGF